MRPTASIVLLLLVTALCLPSIYAQAPQLTAGQVVLEKVATNGMVVPDTQFALNMVEFSRMPYFMEGGTVVFWGSSKHGWRSGLFSAKDGQIKTIVLARLGATSLYAEGIPGPFDFLDPMDGNNSWFSTDIKAGGGVLYITLRPGVFAQKKRSVCVWDGDKLRPVLWHGESAARLGDEKIKAAEVVTINPDGSAMIVYETEGGQSGLATHSKALGLRPLLSTASPLPGMPGVTILKDTFEPLFAQFGFAHRKGSKYKGPDVVTDRDWGWRYRLAPPTLLGDWLFLVVEPSSGHPFLARIGGGKTERIVEEESADPTDPGFIANDIRSFKALTPDVAAVEVADAKFAHHLLVSDRGKLSLVYQFPGWRSATEKQWRIFGQGVEDWAPLQAITPGSKAFCVMADRYDEYGVVTARLVHCFDGTKLSNRATLGTSSGMRAIPGLPGVLVVTNSYTPPGRNATAQISNWLVNGNAVGQELQPAPELFSNGEHKYTLGGVFGVDAATKAVWLWLTDGYYKASGIVQ